MPVRTGRTASGQFQRKTRSYPPPAKGVTLKHKALQSGIAQAVERAMNQILEEMYAVAEQKVPVRKIFKGGRRQLRFASAEEAAEATRAFNRLQEGLPLAQRMQPRFIPAPPGFKGTPSSRQGKQFYRVVDDTSPLTRTYRTRGGESRTVLFARKRTGRDRSADSPPWDARELTEPRSTNPGKLYPEAQARLTSRGAGYVNRREGQSGEYIGGNLKHSLRVVPAHAQVSGGHFRIAGALVAGGERAPYARFVELGTSRAPAQPFLRPALHGAETLFRQRIMAEIQKGIDISRSTTLDALEQSNDTILSQFMAMIREDR